ncbi:MAG: SapC family protein, partial [Tsuneonella sp.]
RRYPFLLAKLQPTSDDLSLCFDPTTDAVGEFDDGQPLFDDQAQPTEATVGILEFCQRFEEAGVKTRNFIEELKKHELLMEGEIAITPAETPDSPYVYRGFQMINEEKLRNLRGDLLRTWVQNGMLALIFAHLFSLDLMRMIFARQVAQGKGPIPGANAPAA